ncbi:CRAL-TRIO domain containing protein [Oryctes borbonicus]|uniref:CRAL-TRIO domain containing protein n=1 Tax=Oryctes borbonicus TaxID=1629725 RepID=A0A0T6B0U3_9SCAR|nr:CRAL-TRIO domain containing protein [Oryctes borbonicus]
MPFPCIQKQGDTKEKQGEEINNLRIIAKKELREEASIREQCLKLLRRWIEHNEDIKNCIVDDNFLLRFLRAKKFSLPMAQQMLLKYLNFRKVFKRACYDMDYRNNMVSDLLDSGFLFASPFRDSSGRRVVVCIPRAINPHRHTSADVTKAVFITFETLIDDERNQIMGLTYIADARGIQPSYVSMWNITEFATLMKWGEHSYPVRHKVVYIMNLPPSIKYVLDFAKTRLSEKLRDRILLFESQVEVHKNVDPKVLPKEYGGEMPISEMIALWKKELMEKRQRLLSFDRMQLISDKGITTRKNNTAEDEYGIQGSFRKLEVD